MRSGGVAAVAASTTTRVPTEYGRFDTRCVMPLPNSAP